MESESLNIMRNGGFEPLVANRLPVVRKSFFLPRFGPKKKEKVPLWDSLSLEKRIRTKNKPGVHQLLFFNLLFKF
jgi:hypothetical protein